MQRNKIPKILIIAGSDSGGGAGIQADIKAVTYFKGYAMTAITAVTSQNTTGVKSIVPIKSKEISSQINFSSKDIFFISAATGEGTKELLKSLETEVLDNKSDLA